MSKFCPICGCRDFNNRCSRCKRVRGSSADLQLPAYRDHAGRRTIINFNGVGIIVDDRLGDWVKKGDLLKAVL